MGKLGIVNKKMKWSFFKKATGDFSFRLFASLKGYIRAKGIPLGK